MSSHVSEEHDNILEDRASTRSYLDEIHLVEGLVAPWFLDIENRDDVFVVEVPKQLHLAQRPQTEHRVVKGGDLLDSDLLARRLVYCRAVPVTCQFSWFFHMGQDYLW